MATQIGQARTSQSDDLPAWARQQAALLRARRFAELDLERLILEVEDLGESEFRSVRSRVRTIAEHLLKLEHSPAHDPRPGWRESIRTQRADLDEDLTPSLRARVEAALPQIYAKARRDAAAALRDYGEDLAADALPASCPYTLDRIVSDWLP